MWAVQEQQQWQVAVCAALGQMGSPEAACLIAEEGWEWCQGETESAGMPVPAGVDMGVAGWAAQQVLAQAVAVALTAAAWALAVLARGGQWQEDCTWGLVEVLVGVQLRQPELQQQQLDQQAFVAPAAL